MNIGITTAAYNGYGRFADQWLRAISGLTIPPAQVTIALGVKHGLTLDDISTLTDKYRDLNLIFVVDDEPVLGPDMKKYPPTAPLMGPMRNLAIAHTNTEWIMWLSIDDVILPGAIEELSKYEEEADYICIKWLSKATWNPRAKVMVHNPKTPEEMMIKYNGRGFIVGHSPFRRKFWEKHPYKPHDYPNAPFVADMVEAGARFAKTEEPCTMYLRRIGSHAQRLVTRGGVDERDPAEKRLANRWKNNMQKRIRKYYRKKWEKDRAEQEK